MRDYYGTIETGKAYLEHFGIKGMRWGIRRYENYDGTLTEAGKRRYRKRIELRDKGVAYLRKQQESYEAAAKRSKAKADKYRKEPNKIVGYNNWSIRDGNGHKKMKTPIYGRDKAEYYDLEALEFEDTARYKKEAIDYYMGKHPKHLTKDDRKRLQRYSEM